MVMLFKKIKIYFLNLKLKNQIEKKYRAKFTSNNLYIARNYLISNLPSISTLDHINNSQCIVPAILERILCTIY